MLAIPDEAIDFTDISVRLGERGRLRRDEDGRLPRRRSPIRETVLAAMEDRQMTAYAVWKQAKAFLPYDINLILVGSNKPVDYSMKTR